VTVTFTLNGADAKFTGRAQARLSDILRERFGLLGAKSSCLVGKCGFCVVLVDGSAGLACLIPAFALKGRAIVTIEGFSEGAAREDIDRGFAEAGLESCRYCEASRILVAEALIGGATRPSKEAMLAAARGIGCRCCDPRLFARGIEKALEARLGRLHGR